MMITVRIPLAQPYAYIEATFGDSVEVNEQELYDLVVRLDDAAHSTPAPRPSRNDADTAPSDRRSGTGLFCPDHNVEVVKTSPQYDKDGDRYYHSLPEREHYRNGNGSLVKNHTVYERQLVGAGDINPDNLPF